ncbi:hypothetical protein FE156_30095 (plasmid) [Streptomyces albidoflavus]|nr:hypothetical protein FE156_30095 [Streptomyces albidoflavus]
MKLPAEPVEHRGLLAALIAHEQFRVDYAGTGVLAEENRYGPYWLRLVTPDAYEPVSREKSARILWDGHISLATRPPTARGPSAGGVRPTGHRAQIFHLRGLEDEVLPD